MTRRFFNTALFCRLARAACAAGLAPTFAAAQSPAAADGQIAPAIGVLLLKNGAVVRGAITESADRWIVTSEGRQMYIPASSVELSAPTMEALLNLRRSKMIRPTADTHLTLADWCLRNDLRAEARQELAAARALDPKHPRLALLERRLSVAIEVATRPPVIPAQPNQVVATVSATAAPHTSEKASSTAAKPAAAPADNLSPAIIESFTRRIQPILLNNCTTTGCHQQGGQQAFQLDRAMLHDLANRQSTMSNLRATLALVDRGRPQVSPLLTVPRAPHGGLAQPVFGPRQSNSVKQLIEWVGLVASLPQSETALATTNPSAVTAAEAERRAETATIPAIPPQQNSLPKFGAQLRPWTPRDPFDPEIFNRRMSREAAATAPHASSTAQPSAAR
jgi:hypothetical protein